jgi:hypothetical protein
MSDLEFRPEQEREAETEPPTPYKSARRFKSSATQRNFVPYPIISFLRK